MSLRFARLVGSSFALLVASSAHAQITIEDGAARVRYGDLSDAAYLTAGVPQTVLSKGLIPHLAGSQFSYRVAGDTREFSVVTDSPDQPTIVVSPANTATITYDGTNSPTSLRGLFTVGIVDTVTESGATITYTRVATFQNVSGAAQTLSVLGYADDVLNSGFNNVSATLLVPNNSIQLTKASSTLNITATGATAFEVTAFPNLIDSLEDGLITTLANGGLPFLPTTPPAASPGDFTGGFSWPSQVLNNGDTASFTMVFQLTAAPFGPGSDGSHIVNAAGTIVNAYAPLDSGVAAGADRLFVPDVSALTLPAGACTGCNLTLSNGDLLMIYQPQGATINTTNSVNYGDVSSIGGAGRYEFVYVANVIDTVAGPDEIEFFPFDGTAAPGGGNGFSNPDPSCVGLRYSYNGPDVLGVAPSMVVRVPQYSFLRVEPGASVVARDWNWDGLNASTLGGVLAIDVGGQTQATGILELGGALSADGAGFRGGNDPAPGGTTDGINTFVSAASAEGAEKGESVVGTLDRYDALGGRFARGAAANGGGGGVGHNSGGGGGANAGDPAAWTNGRGVRNSAFDAAWALDPEFFPFADNSGGGRGGYTYSANDADALVNGPGNLAVWGGDARRSVGGLGGRPLNGNVGGEPYRRVFFGGGGGAGETNNSNPHRGGDGGGFVFVLARRIEAFGPTNPRISANGAAGLGSTAAPLDGQGGGGGGGSVIVTTSENHPLPATLELQANGGVGGSQSVTNGNEGEGGGGGGGAGVVLVSHTSAIETVTGGANGVTISPALAEFPPNGATSGGAGATGASPDRDGPSSPLVCLSGPDFTTPVTNAYFETERLSNGKLKVRFDSASEVAHAGFFVLGSDRRRLSPFIASSGKSGAEAKTYEVVIDAPTSGELFLADIDIRGKQTVRGPFRVGERFGSAPSVIRYNWSQAQQQLASYRAASRSVASGIARVAVRERGMVRVTHEQLAAAGIDLSGTPANQIAVRTDSGAVARRVRGGAVFGAGSSIEFFGDAKASLWSRDRFYLIEANASQAIDMGLVSRSVSAGAVSTYTAELSYAPQNEYNEVSPVEDPWYADRLVSQGSSVTKTVNLAGPAPQGATGELDIVLWGGIDWPSRSNDHSVRVRFNGQLVNQSRFDGLSSRRIRVPVTVSGGSHQVTIEVPGDTGQPADIIHVESVTLRYPTLANGNGSLFVGKAVNGTRSDTIFQNRVGDGLPAPIAGVITVGNVAGSDLRAYRIVGGNATEYQVSGSPVALYAEGVAGDSELWVGSATQLRSAQSISVAPSASGLFGAPADWVAITHGMFASSLSDLAARRQAQGLTTKIVDVESIYTRYSGGNPTPDAIQRYIKDAKAQLGTDYVVLVGADTTDAPGFANSGSISYVPTPYATTSIFVRYAPADPLLGDVDGDGLSDVAIGRLPVRTLGEAQEAVRKILAYENQPAASQLTLAAGPEDTAAIYDRNFAESSELLAAGAPNSWSITRVYQDTLGLNPARQAIVNAFNTGRSVISYVGHSGPSQWTFDPLLDISQVAGTSSDPNRPNLVSSANQPIVLQFACWTTYFVSPSVDTMAQALMLTPNKGASAIVGASVLLDQASHDAMLVAVSSRLQPGARLGDVVQAAKAALNARPNGAGPELLLGQVLLGDPAQPIR